MGLGDYLIEQLAGDVPPAASVHQVDVPPRPSPDPSSKAPLSWPPSATPPSAKPPQRPNVDSDLVVVELLKTLETVGTATVTTIEAIDARLVAAVQRVADLEKRVADLELMATYH
jgi:hypothetical protein